MTVTSHPLTALRRPDGWSRVAALVTACAVYYCSSRGFHDALVVLTAVAFIGLVVLGLRWPVPVLCLIGLFVPVQTVVLALAYHYGAPASLVRAAGGAKELAVAVVALLAVTGRRRRRARLDAIDTAALVVIAIATLYLLLPLAAPQMLGSQPLQVRLLSWRTEAMFLVFLLALRRVSFSDRERRWVIGAFCLGGVVLAAVAAYEWAAPDSYNSWLINHGVPAYYRDILHSPLDTPWQLLQYSQLGDPHPRAGSLLLSPLVYCWYSLIVAAVGLERLARRTFDWRALLVTSAGAAGVILSGTRSAVIALVLVALASLAYSSPRLNRHRERVGLVLLVGAVAAVPLVSRTSILQRIRAAIAGTDISTQGHSRGLSTGWADLIHQPLGRGLGANPDVGDRFQTSIRVTTENGYLQVGVELGVVAMVAFIAWLCFVIARARKVSGGPAEADRLALAVLAAGVGLALGSMFLHAWLGPTALAFAMVAGLALPHSGADPPVDGAGLRRVHPDVDHAGTGVFVPVP